MSAILPKATTDALRQFNDLAVSLYGIDCTVWIPNNLTTLEPTDMYISPDAIAYTEYKFQRVWFEWQAKDIYKLRKSNAFAESDPPITARFLSTTPVIVNSYITLPIEYANNQYNTLEFECVNLIMEGTYNAEIYDRFKMAPRRKKNK